MRKHEKHDGLAQKRRKYLACLLTVLSLLVFHPDTYTTSYFVPFEMSSIFLLVLICAYAFFFGRKDSGRTKNLSTVVLIYLLLVLSLLISKFINGDRNNFYYRVIIYCTVGLLFSMFMKWEDFTEAYTAAMRFLCVYSLVATTVVLFLNLPIEGLFPTFLHRNSESSGGYMRFKYLVFSSVYVSDYQTQFRNFGPFYEPGRFLLYIFIAICFSLPKLQSNEKKCFWDILLFTLTLISTFSPIGIITALVLVVIYAGVAKRKMIIPLVSAALAAVCLFGIMNNEMLAQTLRLNLDKLQGGGSLMTRIGSIIGYFQAWLSRPVFGWGYTEGMYGEGSAFMRSYTIHNTTTTLTNFACFGMLYGLLHCAGLVLYFLRKNFPRVVNILLLLICMMLINTQRYLDAPLLFILIFYGYSYVKFVWVRK